MREEAAKGRFVSVYIFIFGFMKVQLTERIFIIHNFDKLTSDQILRVMLHEMLRPCSHVE